MSFSSPADTRLTFRHTSLHRACAAALIMLASAGIAAGTTLDGRRVGVSSTGTYWGAAGEQIDLLSGNLNYSIPLMRAFGRGRAGGSFALSYNSQIWRQSGGTASLLGRDIGYGLGWTFQMGSLLWVTDGYVFTDSTGAQYKLDLNKIRQKNLWVSSGSGSLPSE